MVRSLTALLLLLICCTSLANAQVKPSRVRVSEDFMQRLLIKKVSPQWPTDALHVRGVVALTAMIDKSGNVENLEVISGHPMLVPAAIEAVKQWKYEPYTFTELCGRLRRQFT